MNFATSKTDPLFFTGLNLQSQFNLENVTVFNTNEHESTLGQKVKIPVGFHSFCSKCVRLFAQDCATVLNVWNCMFIISLSLFQTKLILEIGMLPGTLNCADFEGGKVDLIVTDKHCHVLY